jgi:RimJ/RimL family protein N-acetyltransferase
MLRPWTDADVDSLVENANDAGIADMLTDAFPHPYTREAAVGFITMAQSHTPTRLFAISVDDGVNGVACGGIGLHLQADIMRRNAELGYWLGRAFWGNGIVTDAVRAMVDYGFNTFDIDRIYARPFGSNLASQRVLEKAGFTLEARFAQTIEKNGRREDELVYARRRGR